MKRLSMSKVNSMAVSARKKSDAIHKARSLNFEITALTRPIINKLSALEQKSRETSRQLRQSGLLPRSYGSQTASWIAS